MKIMDFLNTEAINVDLQANDKKGVVKELVDVLISAGSVAAKDKDKIISLLMERESLGSTGVGQGIGIPHSKTNSVKKLIAALGISKKGVNFESLDGEPVYIIFLLLAPEDSAGPHLKALARISRLLKDKYFRDTLKSSEDKKTVVKIINQEEQKS